MERSQPPTSACPPTTPSPADRSGKNRRGGLRKPVRCPRCPRLRRAPAEARWSGFPPRRGLGRQATGLLSATAQCAGSRSPERPVNRLSPPHEPVRRHRRSRCRDGRSAARESRSGPGRDRRARRPASGGRTPARDPEARAERPCLRSFRTGESSTRRRIPRGPFPERTSGKEGTPGRERPSSPRCSYEHPVPSGLSQSSSICHATWRESLGSSINTIVFDGTLNNRS